MSYLESHTPSNIKTNDDWILLYKPAICAKPFYHSRPGKQKPTDKENENRQNYFTVIGTKWISLNTFIYPYIHIEYLQCLVTSNAAKNQF